LKNLEHISCGDTVYCIKLKKFVKIEETGTRVRLSTKFCSNESYFRIEDSSYKDPSYLREDLLTKSEYRKYKINILLENNNSEKNKQSN
jgi:hypothetical protein